MSSRTIPSSARVPIPEHKHATTPISERRHAVSVERRQRRRATTRAPRFSFEAELGHELAGVHGVCCKSGKDRTAMAVTLEHARHLCRHLGIGQNQGRKICRQLRVHGVRRANVKANTEQDKYAFNQLQVQCLPPCYRPPNGSFSGGILT